MKRNILYLIFIAAAVLIVLWFNTNEPQDNPGDNPGTGQNNDDPTDKPDIEIVTSNLQVPWDVDFLPASAVGGPSGVILMTERPGNLLVIDKDKHVIPISGVRKSGEGGLMGLALHPKFSQNHWIYISLTSTSGGRAINRIERYKFENNAVSERTVILDNIPGADIHDGGQIEFGPDDLLYITAGDAGNRDLAQDQNSLSGKILRLRDDGSIPEDNPFGNAVYSYGHRNPQGLAWDSQGRLWAAEHGPSGIDGGSGKDELNLIEKGKNYGWPVIKGDETREGMETPVINSGTSETWAPSGLAFFEGKLYFAGLRGQTLYAFDPETKELNKHLVGEYGRLRAVKAGPEGLYFTTSNRDGRGQPKEGDDKLILIRNLDALR